MNGNVTAGALVRPSELSVADDNDGVNGAPAVCEPSGTDWLTGADVLDDVEAGKVEPALHAANATAITELIASILIRLFTVAPLCKNLKIVISIGKKNKFCRNDTRI